MLQDGRQQLELCNANCSVDITVLGNGINLHEVSVKDKGLHVASVLLTPLPSVWLASYDQTK